MQSQSFAPLQDTPGPLCFCLLCCRADWPARSGWWLCAGVRRGVLPIQIHTGRCGNAKHFQDTAFLKIHPSKTVIFFSLQLGYSLCPFHLRGQISASDLPPSPNYQVIPWVNSFSEKPGSRDPFLGPHWDTIQGKCLCEDSDGHGAPHAAEPFQPNQFSSASFLQSQGLGPTHCTSSAGAVLSQPSLLHNPCSIWIIGTNEVQLFPTPKALWFFVFWQSSEGRFYSFQCIFSQTIDQDPFPFVPLLKWKLRSDIAMNRQ